MSGVETAHNNKIKNFVLNLTPFQAGVGVDLLSYCA